MNAPIPDNEAARLQALSDFHILDTQAEQAYDDITALASSICRTPIALISLVDGHRQWFKSKVGLSISETPREHAFCGYTIHGKSIMEVADATHDPRFKDNPLVMGKPDIRFYAGAPLLTTGEVAVGSLCVIDRKSRTLEPEQKAGLESLARLAVNLLEFRATSAELAKAAYQIKTLERLLPICPRCKKTKDDRGYWGDVVSYLIEHSDADLTHGVCPDCAAVFRGEIGQSERTPSFPGACRC